jgi:hypothetical protein
MEKFIPTPITQPVKITGQIGIDANGNSIEVGSVIKVQGSDILRKVSAYQDRAGYICALRVDGKKVAFSKYVAAANVEVVKAAA